MKDPMVWNAPRTSFDLSRPLEELLAENPTPEAHRALAMQMLEKKEKPKTSGGYGYGGFYRGNFSHELAQNLEKFHGLNQAIAFRLIECLEGEAVMEHLSLFHDVDRDALMEKMFEKREYGRSFAFLVVTHLDQFPNLNGRSLFEKLLQTGDRWAIVQNPEKFHGVSLQEIAQKMLDRGQEDGEILIQGLKKFHGLNQETFLRLLDVEHTFLKNQSEEDYYLNRDDESHQTVSGNLDSFEDLDQEAAMKLVSLGSSHVVTENIDRFHDIDQGLAFALIENNYPDFVLEDLSRFSGIDLHDLALKLIAHKKGHRVAERLNEFPGIDHQEIADKLIESGQGGSLLSSLSNFNGVSHQDIALKLIARGGSAGVASHLLSLKDIDQHRLALKMIDVEGKEKFQHFIKNFTHLSNDIALMLLDQQDVSVVVNNFRCFDRLSEEVARKFIEKKQGASLVTYIRQFEDLHHDLALSAIDQDHRKAVGEYIVNNIERFLDGHDVIARKLISAGQGKCVVAYLEKFPMHSHEETARQLIDTNQCDVLLKNLNKFYGLSCAIALRAIDASKDGSAGENIVKNIDHFVDGHDAIAIKLFSVGQGLFVAAALEKFPTLSHQDVAQMLFDEKIGHILARYLDKFRGLTQEVAFRLIDEDRDGQICFKIVNNIQSFSEINFRDLALKIIEKHHDHFVSYIFDKIDQKDLRDIAWKMIENGEVSCILGNMEKFSIPHQDIVQKFIDTGHENDIVYSIGSFKNLDWSIGRKLFVLEGPYDEKNLTNNPKFGVSPNDRIRVWDYFSPTNDQIQENEIILDVISRDVAYVKAHVDSADEFIERELEIFKKLEHGFPEYAPARQKYEEDCFKAALSHPSTAKKFVQWFPQLPVAIQQTPWLQAILVEATKSAKEFSDDRNAEYFVMSEVPEMPETYGDVVIDHPKLRRLYEVVGASGRDSQELGGELVRFRRNSFFSEREMQAYLIAVDKMILERNLPGDDVMKQAGVYGVILRGLPEDKHVVSLETFEGLEFCKNAIHDVVTHTFYSQLQRSHNITQEEISAVLNQENKKGGLRSIEKTLADLLVRYIAETEEEKNILSPNFRTEITSLLHEAAEKYLKIYEVDIPLYDKLYEEFDELRETGRSTMEVYLGRDGIYAYFGRKAQGAARRKALGVSKLSPQYLVYPRNFRDNVGKKVLEAYLQQEEVTTEVDPLFYDTGFTGTIPEQIMQIQGFAPEEIENRIRLLSASSDKRRVKGIGGNARSEIVSYIEANVKSENASFAIIRDATSGQLRPVATPTTSRERFLFAVVKQAIARHYWFKEISQGKNLPYVEVAKEKYVLHLVKEAMVNLDGSFLDHADELLHAGHVLKGNDGIVDGDIRRLITADGKTLIAKAADMNRVAVDEHELKILERAQKLGLPGVVPIGLLRLKGGTAYTLMEDVPGLSGRTIRQSLEKKDWSSDEIDAVVADGLSRLAVIADDYRAKMNIDKPWRLKDCIIQLNETSRTLVDIVPLDWERAKAFDPEKPHSVREK